MIFKELNICYDKDNNIKCATSYKDRCENCMFKKDMKVLEIKEILEDKHDE